MDVTPGGKVRAGESSFLSEDVHCEAIGEGHGNLIGGIFSWLVGDTANPACVPVLKKKVFFFYYY